MNQVDGIWDRAPVAVEASAKTLGVCAPALDASDDAALQKAAELTERCNSDVDIVIVPFMQINAIAAGSSTSPLSRAGKAMPMHRPIQF